MEIIEYDLLKSSIGLVELVPCGQHEYHCRGQFRVPKDVVTFMCEAFKVEKKAYENLYLLCMNTDGTPVAVMKLSQGGLDCSLTLPYGIFTRVLLSGVRNFILVHNHLSGSVSPSADDFTVTSRIAEGAKLLELDLQDHIIIGSKDGCVDFFSFLEHGKIKK